MKTVLKEKNKIKVASINNDNSMGYSSVEYFQKRTIDWIMIIFFVLFTWPIVLYTIYRIKKESSGPILFKQSRIGLDGKEFTCYKFRSMYVNDSVNNPYTEENDSRIFPFGHFMRKTRIDELAQLINVIKGDMHIVGPRAEWNILVNEYKKNILNYQLRHSVAPGITGLAQVRYKYGQNFYDTKKKFHYDITYIRKWNIFLEIRILFETILVVLQKRGI